MNEKQKRELMRSAFNLLPDMLQSEVGALKRLQAETAIELDALLLSLLDKALKGEL